MWHRCPVRSRVEQKKYGYISKSRGSSVWVMAYECPPARVCVFERVLCLHAATACVCDFLKAPALCEGRSAKSVPRPRPRCTSQWEGWEWLLFYWLPVEEWQEMCSEKIAEKTTAGDSGWVWDSCGADGSVPFPHMATQSWLTDCVNFLRYNTITFKWKILTLYL